MPLLRWRNPGHDTRRASSMVRGAGCREINLRIRRREKNVLDIPFYRSGVSHKLARPFRLFESQLVKSGVGVEKVTAISRMRFSRSMLEGSIPMLCLILMIGDLLIMMGQHDRSEALFYCFRLEDQVPENHLLRLIDKHISFEFVREQLRDSYSEAGRPSIDPELLLRMLLIGYLYGITSERKLVEELRMHLAWRWFTGLGFDQEIPH